MEYRKLPKTGFTIVELVIAVVVIGILATLTTLGLSRYQQQARDEQRHSKLVTIAEALEKYYDKNGEYPSCQTLLGDPAIVVGPNGPLSGVNVDALKTPRADSSTTNSISCSDITTSSSDQIGYIGDSSSSCQSSSCLKYILQYRSDADGTIKTISSRHSGDINTSGNVALSTGPVTYTSAVINWKTIQNANGYALQRDTTSSFNSANLKTIAIDQELTTYQFTDMSPGTTEYFRMRPLSSTGTGAWSNTIAQTPSPLPVLSLTNTQNTPGQVTESWNSLSNIKDYTIQRADDSGFTTDLNSANQTTTSKIYSDTPVAVIQYYRVRANVTNSAGTNFNGPWGTINYTTYVPTPTSPSVTATLSGTTSTGTSGTATCTQTASVRYAIRESHKANSGAADTWTTQTAWSTTPPSQSVPALQGNRHQFQAIAACIFSGVYSSSVYGTAGAAPVRAINQPAAPTWPSGVSKTWKDSTPGQYMWYGTYCPDSTWANQTWYHSHAWPSATPIDYYHVFGFNDYWYLGGSSAQNVFYEARYTCISSYAAESAWSPLSADNITVNP